MASEVFEGSMAQVDLDSGKVLVVYEMIFNMRLCIGDQTDRYGYERAWCYPKTTHGLVDILTALHEWDGVGEPPGAFIKEVGT